MLKENGIRIKFNCCKNNMKNHWVFIQMVPSPPFRKFFRKLPTHSTPICSKLTTVSKYGFEIYGMIMIINIWYKYMIWYMVCVFCFVKNIFAIHLYIYISHQSANRFPIQTVFGVQLGVMTQWIVYFKIWGWFDFFWIYAIFWVS